MGARRVCACGAKLEESGGALICTGCGAQAQSWRVLLNGRALAAGTSGGHQTGAEVAFTGPFEAGLLSLLEPPQPIRYAVPSSWRQRQRKHQAVRG